MRKYVLPIAIFVAFSIAGWLVFDSKSTADALSNGTSFGAWVETRSGQNEISAFEQLEQRLGAQLPLVRGFNQWEDNLGEDRRFHRWARDGGRDLAVSIKPQRNNGTIIPWRDIANAQPGSRLYQEMQELASSARRYNDNMMVIFHHEPEAGDNTKFGTSSEFQGAFRKLVDVFRAEGASNVEFGWVMTDWAFNVGNFNPNDRRRAELWFPGTNYVDFIGADVYNWNNCRGNTTDPWRSLEELLQPFLNWSSRHPNIPLIIGEVSSAEGGGDRKAQWIDEARNTLSTGVHRDRIAAVMWFHDDGVQDGWPNCQWWLDSSSSSFSAAQRLAQDSFFQAPLRFGATPNSSAPAPTNPPTTAPPPTAAPATTAPTTTQPPRTTTTAAPRPTTTTAAPTTTTAAPTTTRPAVTTTAAPRPTTTVAPTTTPRPTSAPQTTVAPSPPPPPTPTPQTPPVREPVKAATPVVDKVEGAVRCSGRIATIVGTSGDDIIEGTPQADVIHGLGGDDIITGLQGNDVICGGAGADELHGGSGSDVLAGNAGPDLVRGQTGPDTLIGGKGADRLNGGQGADDLRGGDAADRLFGGRHQDVLLGGNGGDTCNGGEAIDRMVCETVRS